MIFSTGCPSPRELPKFPCTAFTRKYQYCTTRGLSSPNWTVRAWIVAVLVAREIMVTGLRAIAAAEGMVVAAEELGKYKMVLQSMAVQALLINYTYFHIEFFAAGMFLLWIAMAVSIWSGVDYFVRVIRVFKPRPQAFPPKRIAL